jgi:histidyl-tRNA synthetase
MIILPKETKLIRRIEENVISIMAKHDFVEVLFPRAMPVEEWCDIVRTLGSISNELQSELVLIPNLGNRVQALCHWQCEPYYAALRMHGGKLPPRVFDRSGWSYRNEKNVSSLRPREFLRIEVVWRGSREEVAQILNTLLDELAQFLESEGILVKRVRQEEEIRNSNQRNVIDLVVDTPDGQEVEVVGGHLHGSGFVGRFWQDAPQDMETACMGVSLTRLARLLTSQSIAD